MASQNTQTRVILSAEDRGVSKLMNKIGAQTDAFIDQFSRIGGVLSTALGGAGVGYGLKQALSIIDEMRQDVNGVAVTLTDAFKGSSAEIAAAFKQNQAHAESFFKVLRRQSAQSISDFNDLRNAYSIVTGRGMSLKADDKSAKMLANVVDRIRLATRGQSSDIQIFQEMRSLMNGTSKQTDALAQLFKGRDADFLSNVKALVGRGDAQALFEYLNTLLADVDVSSVISGSLSKQTGRIRTEIELWAADAFSPLYDVVTGIASETADAIGSGESSVLKGVKDMAEGLAATASSAGSAIQRMRLADAADGGAKLLDVLGRSAPKLIAIALAAKGAAASFGLLAAAVKSSVTMMGTIPGMITVGVMGYTVARDFAASGNVPRYEDGVSTDTLDEFKWGLDIFLEMAKNLGVSLLNVVTEFFRAEALVIKAQITDVVNLVREACHWVKAGIDALGNFFNIDALKFDEFTEKRKSVAKTNDAYADRVIRDATELARWKWDNSPLEIQNAKVRLDTLIDMATDKKGTSQGEEALEEIVRLVSRYAGTVWGGNAYAADMMNVWRNAPASSVYAPPTVKETSVDVATREGARLENTLIEAVKGLGSLFTRSLEDVAERRTREFAKPIAPGRVAAATTPREMPTDYSAEQKAALAADKTLTKLVNEFSRVQTLYEQYSGTGENTRIKAQLSDSSGQLEIMDEYNAAKAEAEVLEKQMQTFAEAEKVAASKRLSEMYASLASMGDGVADKLQGMIADLKGKALEAFKTAEAGKAADEYQAKIDGLRSMGQSSGASGDYMRQAEERMRSIADIQSGLVQRQETLAEAEARRNALASEYKATAAQTLVVLREEADYLAEQSRLIGENSLSGSFKAELNELNRSSQSAGEIMKDFWADTAQQMQTSMSDGFYNIFKGNLSSLKDVFENFCDGIIRAWSDMIASMVAKKAFSWLGNAFGGALDGLFDVEAAANGGVFRGGFRAFANGGTVTSPTLGLVGEGRYNEAVVPLPDGRSIPVVQRGGGANVTVNITDNSGSATSKDVSSRTDDEGNTIIDVVIDAIAGNKKNFRTYLKSQVATT